MPTSGNQIRRCLIEASGGPVVVRLQANNALRAAGDFNLLASDSSQVLENWQMAAGDSGASDHTIQIPVASLNNAGLTWEILCCSMVPHVDSGTVEIQVLQNGVSCPITKPAQWSLSDVPQCSEGQTISITSSLSFLFL